MTKFRVLDESLWTDQDKKNYDNSVAYISSWYNGIMEEEFYMKYYGNYSISEIESMAVPEFYYHQNMLATIRAKEREEADSARRR